MVRRFGRGVLFAILLACAVPARADPLLMLILSIAQEMIVKSIERGASAPKVHLPDLSKVYAGTSVEPEDLVRLIDDCFTYLSSAQREEIFNALHLELLKPKNAAVRGVMIQYFAERALQVRDAQIRLSNLSIREMEALAAEFRATVPTIPEKDVAILRTALNAGLIPIPTELSQMLLTSLGPEPVAATIEKSFPAPAAVPTVPPKSAEPTVESSELLPSEKRDHRVGGSPSA